MNYTFNNEIPIYIQIAEIITKEISSGILKPGSKIPSVREYALKLKANPNTVSRALFILEQKKLIHTDRTNGKYVTNDLEIIKEYRKDVFEKKIDDFLIDLKLMGYSKEEILNKIMEQ